MHKTLDQTLISMGASGLLDLACQFSKGQPIQFAVEKGDHIRGLPFLPAVQEGKTLLALIPHNILIHTQQAILAFTDPECMEIVNCLCHGKGREAPLPMDLLHEAKTGLECRLQLLKHGEFLRCQLLSYQSGFHTALLQDILGVATKAFHASHQRRNRSLFCVHGLSVKQSPLNICDEARHGDAARATFRAIEDRAAARGSQAVAENRQALRRPVIPTIEDEAMRVHQRRRSHPFWIGPGYGTGTGTASTENTFGPLVRSE